MSESHAFFVLLLFCRFLISQLGSLNYHLYESILPLLIKAMFPVVQKMLQKTQKLFCSVQFSSVTLSCPTLCDPMNRSTPGLPVHHQLQEFTQTHVHQVADAIQPSHPLSSRFPPTPQSLPASGYFPMSQLFT